PGGFKLIPGAVGIARMADLSPREQARLVSGLSDLDREADLVLIDTGAGLGREIISFMNCADMAVIVTTPEPTAIADAYALIKCVARRMNASGGAGAQGLRIADPAIEPSRLTLVA